MDFNTYVIVNLRKMKMPINRNNIEWMENKLTMPDTSKPNLLATEYEQKKIKSKEDIDKLFLEFEKRESAKLEKEIDKVLSKIDNEEAEEYSMSCNWEDLDVSPNFHSERDRRITELLDNISLGVDVSCNFDKLARLLNNKLYYTAKTIYKSISNFPNFFCLDLRGYEDIQQELTIQLFNFAKTFHDKTFDENNVCKFNTIGTNCWFKKISHNYFCKLVRFLSTKCRSDKEFIYLDNNFGDEDSNNYYNKVGYNESGYSDFEIEDCINRIDLSDRKKEVLRYLYQGYSIKDIAEKLNTSTQYVSKVRREIKNKLTK